MTIIQLTLKNFRKIKAAFIKFENGKPVVIKGGNAEGKTSVMMSILNVFKMIRVKDPVNINANKCETEIIIGNEVGQYTIKETRNKKGEVTTLKIDPMNGSKPIHSSQKASFLKGLLSVLAKDPLLFYDKKDEEQFRMLKNMVKLDFTILDKAQKEREEARLEIGQKSKLLKEQLTDDIEAFKDVPDEPVDTDKVHTEIKKLENQKENRGNQLKKINDNENKLVELQKEKEDLLLKINSIVKAMTSYEKANQAIEKELIEAVDETELKKLELVFKNSSSINVAVQQKKNHLILVESVEQTSKDYEQLNEEITAIRDQKKKMVETAKFPIKGLTICPEKNIIKYNGLPLSEASKSQRMEVSMDIAIAGMKSDEEGLNVLFIEDASLFDNKTLERISSKKPNDKNIQIFFEKVDNTVSDGSIEISAEEYEIVTDNTTRKDIEYQEGLKEMKSNEV